MKIIRLTLALILMLVLNLSIFTLTMTEDTQKESIIFGTIVKPLSKEIKIGDRPVIISKSGYFSAKVNLKYPALFELEYASMKWTVYMEPGKKTELLLPERKIASIKYKGDLTTPNNFLKEVVTINKELESYLNKNWLKINSQDFSEYSKTILSLKKRFLKPLTSLVQSNRNLSGSFEKIFRTEIDLSFTTLMLKYYRHHHLAFTGKTVNLPENIMDKTRINILNQAELKNLPSYPDYCKAVIDYKAKIMAGNDKRAIHFDLKKMDTIFSLLPKIFENRDSLDTWLYKYLTDHMDTHGFHNSTKYLDHFLRVCKSNKLKQKVKKLSKIESTKRQEHDVRIYKQTNGFKLEAYIFEPEKHPTQKKRSAIAIFHGGGWNGGKPDWAFNLAEHFSSLGMVAVAVQYRLTNNQDITALESMADARDLIKWMRINADTLKILPDKIAAYGWSAGAHLVSSTAIFPDSIDGGKITSVPDAMILSSPAVSLPKDAGWEVWKLSVFGPKTTVSSANPVEHIQAGLPPVIILQGRTDTVTPLKGVQHFTDRMQELGNYCDLVIYDKVGHLFTPSHLDDTGYPKTDKKVYKDSIQKADEFLQKFKFLPTGTIEPNLQFQMLAGIEKVTR